MSPRARPEQNYGGPDTNTVIAFYDTHPINLQEILAKVRSARGNLQSLKQSDLTPFDNDHYGGEQAIATLASRAGITAADRVLDVGSGMGGPARYLADTIGCRVTGLDITESRCRGATELANIVGLNHLVEFRVGDATNMPFDDACFTTVIGQEAWSHIDNKKQLLSECGRVLVQRGVLAFTDITEIGDLTVADRERLCRQAHMPSFGTYDGYRRLITASGMTVISQEDLSQEWAEILAKRVDMYRSLEAETTERFGRAHYEAFIDMYTFFASMFINRKLGGARFVAVRAS